MSQTTIPIKKQDFSPITPQEKTLLESLTINDVKIDDNEVSICIDSDSHYIDATYNIATDKITVELWFDEVEVKMSDEAVVNLVNLFEAKILEDAEATSMAFTQDDYYHFESLIHA